MAADPDVYDIGNPGSRGDRRRNRREVTMRESCPKDAV